MPKAQSDKFANQAVITVTESAANTLTFKKLETGISLFEKLAWLICRVEYFPANLAAAIFNGDGDGVNIALTTTDQLTSIAIANNAVLDLMLLARNDYGAAATMLMRHGPITKDFSTLPGGGLLVPPNPLYAACVGNGLVSAMTVYVKLFYTTYELSPEEYWELVESRRMIAS